MQRNVPIALFAFTAFLVACGGGGSGSPPGPAPTNPANPGGSSSSASPTPTPSATPMAQSQLVYAANGNGNGQILAFQTGVSGNLTPVKTMSGPQTLLNYPAHLAFDSPGNLYVANGGLPNATVTLSITVYAKGSNGNATPVRVIEGANTGFNNARTLDGLAVDRSGYTYVSERTGSATCTSSTCVVNSNDTIAIFAPSANGNVAPTRTFTSSDCFAAGEIVIEPSGDISITCDIDFPNYYGNQIVTFAASSSGNVRASRVIPGARQAGQSLALSPLGILFETSYDPNNTVEGFPDTANDNGTPTVILTDGGTFDWQPVDLAEDSNSVLYVLNNVTGGEQILEFNSAANGDAPPRFTISGSNTGLSNCNSGACYLSIAVGPP